MRGSRGDNIVEESATPCPTVTENPIIDINGARCAQLLDISLSS